MLSNTTVVRTWHLRAEQIRTLASEQETEPKAIMLRIADDYERLAAWIKKRPSGLHSIRRT
jgi:hypothetical protein